jgi:hypothetical protein
MTPCLSFNLHNKFIHAYLANKSTDGSCHIGCDCNQALLLLNLFTEFTEIKHGRLL